MLHSFQSVIWQCLSEAFLLSLPFDLTIGSVFYPKEILNSEHMSRRVRKTISIRIFIRAKNGRQERADYLKHRKLCLMSQKLHLSRLKTSKSVVTLGE